jgi:hypothetical protein
LSQDPPKIPGARVERFTWPALAELMLVALVWSFKKVHQMAKESRILLSLALLPELDLRGTHDNEHLDAREALQAWLLEPQLAIAPPQTTRMIRICINLQNQSALWQLW